MSTSKADLLERIAHLSDEKRALLEARLAEAGKEKSTGIPKCQPMDSYPLSFAQESLWFLSRSTPNNAFYNEASAARLTGRLDVDALERSIREIVQRHEILRTVFVDQRDSPEQVVITEPQLIIKHVNLEHYTETEQMSEAQQLIRNEVQQPFDLRKDTLIRVMLLRLAPEQHILLIALHHIVADDWSIRILIHELSVLYRAFSIGKPSPLSALPVQYADYAVWQRDWLQGERLTQQLGYWKQQLADAPVTLDLPADRPRPVIPSYRGKNYYFSIPSIVTEQLRTLSRREETTLFMTLLAGFGLLLSRYTGEQDFCIGTSIANRNRIEIESLIGFFANTVVLRNDFSGNPTFVEVLGRVKKTCLDAQSHQDLPFEKLVEALSPVRNVSYNPFFQVKFDLQNAGGGTLVLSGVELSKVEIDTGGSKFDLTLNIREENEGLAAYFEYSTDLFDESMIIRMAGHFQRLLEGIVSSPDKRLADLPLLTDSEHIQLLDWNATEAAYPQNYYLHQLFEEQVGKNPNAIAVIFEDQQLTYEQLNAKANQLAHYLRAQGVGPEVLVGICVERSLEMVIGILGILKTGGAYVPIDPKAPWERIADVLSNTRPVLVLTQKKLQGQLPSDIQRLNLDSEWSQVAEERTNPVTSAVTPDNLAYVLHTSGSTGKPKGVAVSHRNVINSTQARLDYYRQPINSFLLLSSITFDSSIAGLFGTLSQGGCLVLPQDNGLLDVSYLTQLITDHKVSHLLAVPSLYKTILRQIATDHGDTSLKAVLVAGEACYPDLVKLHDQLLPQTELFNEYGPTEATIWSSVHQIQPGAIQHTVSIGRPIANTQIYLLDAHLNLVPVGVPGELYIGGVGLTRGYLNRPDLTAERFIPNLFSQQPGERLYRTGDLARYRADGNIEYLGRTDHQVKIRGFRIELGEIEAALLQHEQIKEAVVIVREDSPQDKRLVAYITGNVSVPDIETIRTHIKTSLPDYMVPSAFVFLDSFPLTPNGKLDRQALPAPDISEQLTREDVAPRNPTEAILADIWAEVLGVEKVSIHDNFFELGGHSLLVMQVVVRVQESFAIDFPVDTLFEKPTIIELAKTVNSFLGGGQISQSLPLTAISRTSPLVLSFAQRRLWFLDRFGPNSAFYNMAGAIRLIGELDVGVLKRSLNEIVRRHEVLRTTFDVHDGQPVQVIAPVLELDIAVADLSQLSGDRRKNEVERYLVEEACRPFDLAIGPLVRATLLSLGVSATSGHTEHILLFSMHHIISDGWSTGILVREFVALYEAFKARQSSTLPELTIQYADYAAWQREWLQGDRLAHQLNYWKQQLAGAPAVLELPTDRPRPAVQSYLGANYRFTIPENITAQLKVLSQQEGTTLFMTLLTAFNVLLSRYSNQHDICIGTPVANRNRIEIEGLIGFFVSTLVLRIDLSGNPTFTQLLKKMKAVCLDAQAHQDLPFEKLVEELVPVRDMSRNPLFQVMFALQNVPETQWVIDGLQITPVEVDTGSAKFDLHLEITERHENLEALFNYNTDLFDESTIVRMAEHFQRLLEGVVSSPDKRLVDLPLLLDFERKQLLDWNATEEAYPRNYCLHQLFEAQVEKSPDAIAVVFEDQQLTYAQLNAKANQLAHYLRAQGVGPEVLVGICMERSLEMVVGILGILKAGGAYLPIDPGYPRERIAFMLEDAQPVLNLIHTATREVLPENIPAVDMDAQWQAIAQCSEDNPLNLSRVQNLAYVIYTSGSTGKPKGAGLVHQGIVNRLEWMQQQYLLSINDRVLQKTPFGFDVSVWEFLWPLLTGAGLVVAPPEAHKDAMRVAQMIQDHKITIVHFVPSMLSAFLDMADVTICRSLRYVICSGEALSTSLQQKFFEKLPAQLHNLYGPTEASIDVTMWACEQGSETAVVPIGRPIANTQIYLLDAFMNPVPVGVSGELYIGGVGLARGYQNRSTLTAERFIPNPFSKQLGERLYRTGDLARYRTDGNIEYLGRIDHQVKIRGFRIELEEIEASLLQLEQIKEAVVIVRDDSSEDKRLVAYITGNEPVPDIEMLRTHLKTSLPDYMVPPAFVFLDSFPLTPNGKLDRKALPAPDISDQLTHGYVAPRNPTEAILADIWAEVLGVEKVGIYDNFFELGGHSLLAITLIECIRKQGLHAEVRMLFSNPTISGFAAELSNVHAIEIPENLIPSQCELITPDMLPLVTLTQAEINNIAKSIPGGMRNIQDIYPLAPLQEGILFHHLMDSESDPYLLSSLLAFDTREQLDSFLDTLQAVINQHDILRTSIVWEGLSEPVQTVWHKAVLQVEEVEINVEPGDVKSQLKEKYSSNHFRVDVREAPLLRGYIVWDKFQRHWVLWILHHHLTIDHVTLEILLQEIQLHLTGRSGQLKESFPFRNYIAQICSEKQSTNHEVFFRRLLGDITEPTAPFGLLDIQKNGLDISEVSLDIDSGLSHRIHACVRSLGVNAASLFHLAWARLLAQVSATQDVVFGTVLFGRMQGSEGVIQAPGMFINTLPVRFHVSETSVQASIKQMYQQLTELIHHEHASLALAQRCSGIAVSTPLFSALLNYRHNKKELANSIIEGASLWPGMKVLSVEERTTYPVTLAVDDSGEEFRLTAQVQTSIDPHRVCQYMQTVLEGLVDALGTNPNKIVCSINTLPVSERDQLLDWNATEEAYPRNYCLHQLFEAQVEKSPDAIAVVFEDQQLTYAQLNAKANQLAHYLRAQGVGPEVLVGICMERSLEMVVGILGILKAGGAYLPIDPGYPRERIAFMLEDAQPVLNLIHTATREVLPENIPAVDMDAQWQAIAQCSEDNPLNLSRVQNLAYVIYTSGSTGKPKGAGLVHQGIVNRLEWMQQQYLLSINDRVLQKTPFGFDVSVWEFLWPLLTGAGLVVAPPEAHKDAMRVAQMIQDHKITIVHFVPSMLSAFLDMADVTICRSLRYVICSGEALSTSLQQKFFEKLPAQLHNLYGPTEASIDVTMWACEQGSETAVVPIGRPIANTQIYLLDAFMNPVPVGVSGELYIGGVGLARGYQNRSTLTAERFIPNPFSKQLGERLYRTGDLARYRTDGNIEYLGRIDHQVKIRGFRIELEEIEASLLQLEQIKEAVVIVRDDSSEDKRLVAYITGNEPVPDIEMLRTHLKTSLPDYMVPPAFVFLDSFPLTPNGKLDRKALPAPDISDQLTHGYVAPRNPTEAILADIWAEVLGVEKVGIYDNFFELGGHSLLVMQIILRINTQFKAKIPIHVMFKEVTIETLAKTIEIIQWIGEQNKEDIRNSQDYEEFEL
ncbi:amino acid adenylation domain-containing protein [Nitrosomonas sp.]|uniref:amino acid adenylation domain-containing protein n=2 Tax=Nitrosomonas sp. TaxID=42353 RepID=UPI0037CC3120